MRGKKRVNPKTSKRAKFSRMITNINKSKQNKIEDRLALSFSHRTQLDIVENKRAEIRRGHKEVWTARKGDINIIIGVAHGEPHISSGRC